VANLVLRSIVWIGALAVWLILRWPDGMDWTTVSWRPTAVIGAMVAIVGITCFLWSARSLADKVPNAITAPAQLLARGPYAYVRNPLYLSAGAVFAGVTTMYGVWQRQDLIVVPIVAILAHLFVVYREEPRTRARLGSVYDTYCATVPRWIPNL
jgi:protein-S-isoprenylcysteine O-methyltransferase Ste14